MLGEVGWSLVFVNKTAASSGVLKYFFVWWSNFLQLAETLPPCIPPPFHPQPLPSLHYQHQFAKTDPLRSPRQCVHKPKSFFSLTLFLSFTDVVLVSSHFHPDLSEVFLQMSWWRRILLWGKRSEKPKGEEKGMNRRDEEEEEESLVDSRALLYRLGSWGVVRQDVEEVCELRKVEGGSKSNTQPFSDYWYGAALDVHWGLNRKMDFFKKLLNT